MSSTRRMKPTARRDRYSDWGLITFCGAHGKHGYESRRRARRAATELQDRAGEILRPYRCPECDAWHLTSKAGS